MKAAAAETEVDAPLPDDEAGGWSAGAVVLGDFVVECELGRGGMGAVHLVRSRTSGKRYAVKRALAEDERARVRVLSEVVAWMALPRDPHLVACEFVRTRSRTDAAGGGGFDIVVFAEYVDGGSLSARIAQGQLRRVGDLVDASLQLARALKALHDLGLVHQDVKPANALVTLEGVVKLADFGLARAFAETGAGGVAVRGMTPAYASPEQALRRTVGPASDAWSWGVSVLEMLVGEVTWTSGIAAPHVLETLSKAPAGPVLPPRLTALLERCLLDDPVRRATTSEIVEELETVTEELGVRRRAIAHRPRPVERPFRRRVGRSVTWADPVPRLRHAASLVGATARPTTRSAASTFRGQLAADWLDLELTLGLLARCGADAIRDRVDALLDLAVVTRLLGDTAGAIDACERAGRIGDAFDAAVADSRRGMMLSVDGAPAAAEVLDRAIAALEPLAAAGRVEALRELARALTNRAVPLLRPETGSEAVALLTRAVEIRRGLLGGADDLDVQRKLAVSLSNRGGALAISGRCDEARADHEEAVGICEGLRTAGAEACTAELGEAHAMAAQTYETAGDPERARAARTAAIAALDAAVSAGEDAGDTLARACVVFAEHVDDGHGRAALLGRAAEILEERVGAGDTRSAELLYRAWSRLGDAFATAGDHDAAVRAFARGAEGYARLVAEGARELRPMIGEPMHNMANSLSRIGRMAEARAAYERALEVIDWASAEPGSNAWRVGAMTSLNAASFLRTIGDAEASHRVLDRALAIVEATAPDQATAALRCDLVICKGNALHASGARGEAARRFEAALGLAEQYGEAVRSMSAAVGLAMVSDTPADGLAWIERAERHLDGSMGGRVVAFVALRRADVLESAGDEQGALDALDRAANHASALDAFHALHVHVRRARAAETVGNGSSALDAAERALSLLAARPEVAGDDRRQVIEMRLLQVRVRFARNEPQEALIALAAAGETYAAGGAAAAAEKAFADVESYVAKSHATSPAFVAVAASAALGRAALMEGERRRADALACVEATLGRLARARAAATTKSERAAVVLASARARAVRARLADDDADLDVALELLRAGPDGRGPPRSDAAGWHELAAAVLVSRAHRRRSLGNATQALESFESARVALTRAEAEGNAARIAAVDLEIASVLRELGRARDAAEAAGRAAEILERLAAEDPPAYADRLAAALEAHAVAREVAGDAAGALGAFQRASAAATRARAAGAPAARILRAAIGESRALWRLGERAAALRRSREIIDAFAGLEATDRDAWALAVAWLAERLEEGGDEAGASALRSRIG